MTTYPTKKDTTATFNVVNGVTVIDAAFFAKISSAILAIENELGVNPSGIYLDLRQRLDVMADYNEAGVTPEEIAAAIALMHTQNTDTSTVSATFQLDFSNDGTILKNTFPDDLSIRNGTDSDYSSLFAKDINCITIKDQTGNYATVPLDLFNAVLKSHYQNTDSYTTSPYFQLNTNGIKIQDGYSKTALQIVKNNGLLGDLYCNNLFATNMAGAVDANTVDGYHASAFLLAGNPLDVATISLYTSNYFQSLNANLTALSGVIASDGNLILETGPNTFISGKLTDGYVLSLSQNKTHDNVDTDTALTAIHHTLGTDPFQAAAGDHLHNSDYQPLDSTLTNLAALSNLNEYVMLSTANAFFLGKITDGYVVSLSQSKTHDNVDTDTSLTAIHHTLGTSAFQAAAGDHSHSTLTGLSNIDGYVIISGANSFGLSKITDGYVSSLSQSKTHDNVDTDTSLTALHHTIGLSSFQTAAGDHQHNTLTTLPNVDGYVILSTANSFFMGQISDGYVSSLSQNKTHANVDTDSSLTALHHTLGTGSNQAAAGDHEHSILNGLSYEDGYIILSTANNFFMGKVSDGYVSSLSQSKTHDNVDTDTSLTALHHTLGVSSFQAAAGDHQHNTLTTLSNVDGYVVLSTANSFFMGQISDGYVSSLSQNKTHDNVDTDISLTALHHTLGTGSNQAAAGDHGHSILNGLSYEDGYIILSTANNFFMGKVSDGYVSSLSQNKTHDNVDTDTFSAIHHTIGNGNYQVVSGSDPRLHYQNTDSYTESNTFRIGNTILDCTDQFRFIINSVDGYANLFAKNIYLGQSSIEDVFIYANNQLLNTELNSYIKFNNTTKQWEIKNDGYLSIPINYNPSGEPIGFESRLDSYLSFDNITRELTIAPKAPYTSFDIWDGLIKYTKNSPESIQISDVIGPHYIYFINNQLQDFITPQGFNKVIVSIIYWEGSSAIGIGDERHGLTMDWATHQYIHNSIGTAYSSGFSLAQLSVGTGNNDTDCQISLTDGVIMDEDIVININRKASPINDFEQELGLATSIPCNFNIYCRDGTGSTNWKIINSINYPCTPWDGILNSRIGYNYDNAGTWSVADPGDGYYIAYFIIATNIITNPVIVIMGQRADLEILSAEGNNTWSSLALGTLPVAELKPLYCLIIKTDSSYANAIKGYIHTIQDIRNVASTTAGSYSATIHSNLIGNILPGSHPAIAINTDITNFNNILSGSDISVQLALDTLDNHAHSALYQPLNTKLTSLSGLSNDDGYVVIYGSNSYGLSKITDGYVNSLSQSKTHDNIDTDNSASSIHHTLGTGQYQSAAGDHLHSAVYQPLNSKLTDLSGLSNEDGYVVIYGSNSYSLSKITDGYVFSLSQSKTHDNPDTDVSNTSIHHTLGLGATQAAIGNHLHDSYYVSLNTIPSNIDNTVLLSSSNSYFLNQISDAYVSSLSQSKTHYNVDTDSSLTAIHHTLGTGPFQAVSGSDSRLHNQNTDSYTTSNSFQIGIDGPILTRDDSILCLKNSTNDGYTDIHVKNIYLGTFGLEDVYIYASAPYYQNPVLNSYIKFNNATKQWEIKNDGYMSVPINFDPAGRPLGFNSNGIDSYMWIDDSLKRFYIAPKAPYTEYKIWQGMKYYIKTTVESVAFDNTKGEHYFLFCDGVLTVTTIFPGFNSGCVWVAEMYWDGTKNLGISDQRHGTDLSPAVFEFINNTIGPRYYTGLTIGRIATGTGSADGDCQISLTDGVIYDEDITVNIVRKSNPIEEFEQELGLDATIPGKFSVLYRLGADANNWTGDAYTNFPVRPWDGIAGSRIGYNLDTGGTWSVADPGNTNYVAMWICANNSQIEPVISIMGQRFDTTLQNAQNNNIWSSMNMSTSLILTQLKVLYRIILRTQLSYSNTIKAYIADVQDLRGVQPMGSGSYIAPDHNSLAGRDIANSHPATAISADTSSFNGILSAANTDVQLALNTIDDHRHDAYYQPLNTKLTSLSDITNQDSYVVISGAHSFGLSKITDGYVSSLSQSKTHNFPDTDISITSLHHTLGTGATQAAIGSHLHDAYYLPLGIIPTINVNQTVLLSTANSYVLGKITDGYVLSLSQNKTHDSPDTDTATTSLHHTLGTGANQAAAGNHTHAHSTLTGLTSGDDHTQYVSNATARTITANHTFDNAVFGGAPFTIGISSTDILVTGLNADKLDGFNANQFALTGDSRFHTQNTDTGTTQTSFQLQSGSSGVKLQNTSGNLAIRTSANDAYANLYAKDTYLGTGGSNDVYIYANTSDVNTNNSSYIKFNNTTKQWEIKNDGYYFNVPINYSPSGEPIGFENQTDSYISFNDSNRTFTIAPKSPATSYNVWYGLRKFTKTTAESIQIGNTAGLHYIYFNNSNGILTDSSTFPNFNQILVSFVYWNGTKNIGVSDERHGMVMDWNTHKYLHNTVGCRYESGLVLTNLLVGTGASDLNAQVSLTGGVINDEDLRYTIIRTATPTNPFEQELGLSTSIPAQIPIYYRTGTGADNWTADVATNFICRTSGGTSATRLAYNLDTAGTWSIAQVASGNFVAMFIYATNNKDYPIIAVMGQRQDTNLLNSQTNATLDTLTFGNMLSAEFKILYRLILQTNLSYANSVNAFITNITDYRAVSTLPSGTYISTNHSSLTGLTELNAHPASSIYTDITNFNGILSSSNTDVQSTLDTIDDHAHPTLYQPLDSTLTGLASIISVDGYLILSTGLDTFISGKLTDGYVDSLSQSKTHRSPDTDVAITSLHHTLGTGKYQAAAGNDARLHYQNTDSYTTSNTFGINYGLKLKNDSGNLLIRNYNDDGYTKISGYLRAPSSDGAAMHAPLKFYSGTLLSIPEPGTIEYSSDGYFYNTCSDVVRNLLSTYTATIPTTPLSSGKKGQFTADGSFAYICYSDNSWIRIAKDPTWT